MRSKLRLGASVAAVAALVATNAFAGSSYPATSTAAGDCSKETALEVAKPLLVWGDDVREPIGQVLCGAFTGPGSDAMAVTFNAPTCWPIQRWAVYSRTAGVWRLVLDQPAYLVPPLVAVGSDLRETTAVHRSGDPRCLPSGGTRARSWRWDGAHLVAGPWKQVTPGEAKPRWFYSPSGNIDCGMGDTNAFRGVFCNSLKAPQRVDLAANGRLKICRGRRCVPFACGCREEHPTLGYGRQITVGRFRCASLRTGVRCTVIRTGKGFLINSRSVIRVGP